jgi:hypothetical protein
LLELFFGEDIVLLEVRAPRHNGGILAYSLFIRLCDTMNKIKEDDPEFGFNEHAQSKKAEAIRKLEAALSQLTGARDGSRFTGRRGDIRLDAGRGRRRECMATRFDRRNIAGQCKKENHFEGGDPFESGFAFNGKLRKGTAAELFEFSKTIKQREIGELKQLTGAAT